MRPCFSGRLPSTCLQFSSPAPTALLFAFHSLADVHFSWLSGQGLLPFCPLPPLPWGSLLGFPSS